MKTFKELLDHTMTLLIERDIKDPIMFNYGDDDNKYVHINAIKLTNTTVKIKIVDCKGIANISNYDRKIRIGSLFTMAHVITTWAIADISYIKGCVHYDESNDSTVLFSANFLNTGTFNFCNN